MPVDTDYHSSLVADVARAVPRSNDNQLSAIRPWLTLWMMLALPLLADVVGSWYACLSTRSFSDNLIPALTAVILVCAGYFYSRSAPSFVLGQHYGGLLLLILMSWGTAAGWYLHLSRLYWFGALGMIVGLLWGTAGRKYCSHWLPMVFFASQLVPGPPLAVANWAVLWLKWMSAKLATSLAALFIPISVNGTVFYVKGFGFEVTAACSGLSMCSGLTFVVLLWQLVHPMSVRQLSILIAASLVTAVMFNGMRLWLTALVAYWSSPQTAVAIHSNLEYVLFPLALLLLWNCRRAIRA